MRTHPEPTAQSSGLRRAFTVTELMVAVGLMSLIILVLYSVFNQTQRAMRHNETQNDISEKARAVMELVTREIEQVAASSASRQRNFLVGLAGLPAVPTVYTNPLDGSSRTNVLNELFFLTHTATNWGAIGYKVLNSADGVGTLMRFSPEPQHLLPGSNYFLSQFVAATNVTGSSSNLHYVAEGLVHFKITPTDKDGRRLGWDTTNRNLPFLVARVRSDGKIIPEGSSTTNLNAATVVVNEVLTGRPESSAIFLSNALPAYVQVEIGLLEPDVVRQYGQMVADSNPRAGAYVQARLSRTQLYRQIVTIRQISP